MSLQNPVLTGKHVANMKILIDSSNEKSPIGVQSCGGRLTIKLEAPNLISPFLFAIFCIRKRFARWSDEVFGDRVAPVLVELLGGVTCHLLYLLDKDR